MSSGSDVTAVGRATPAELIVLSRDRLRRSENDAAKATAGEAEEIARTTGDRAAQAEALTVIANCWRLQDDYPEALEVALRAVVLCRELGDLAAGARARSTIARVLMGTGDTAEALQECLAALEMARPRSGWPGRPPNARRRRCWSPGGTGTAATRRPRWPTSPRG
jgi:tetratricopeptide (TPR) repeat protein